MKLKSYRVTITIDGSRCLCAYFVGRPNKVDIATALRDQPGRHGVPLDFLEECGLPEGDAVFKTLRHHRVMIGSIKVEEAEGLYMSTSTFAEYFTVSD